MTPKIEIFPRHRHLPIIACCQSAEQRQGGLSARCARSSDFFGGTRSMSTKSAKLRILGDWVFEKDCAVCGQRPRAERAKRRSQGGYVTKPFVGTCARCWAAFWEGVSAGVTPEEHKAVQQA